MCGTPEFRVASMTVFCCRIIGWSLSAGTAPAAFRNCGRGDPG
jgi:hypothetical protein